MLNQIQTVRVRAALSLSILALTFCASALNYDVNFTSNPPTIDGSAADAAWASASSPATNFVVYNNVTVPSNQQTSVRCLWDDTSFYLLYEAQDNDIVSSATGPDTGFFSGQDQLEMYLDPSWGQHSTRANYVYHIAVDAGLAAHTYTASGNDQTTWSLSAASQVAVAHSGSNWTVEMAIAWADLNSTYSLSPGVVLRAPINNTIWGGQFARTHSMLNNDNNTTYSKWNDTTSGSFRARPIGNLTFKGSPTLPAKPDLSSRIVTKTFDFEAPTYTSGNTVTGLENWSSAQPAIFLASNSEKFSGSQAMQIVASTTGRVLNNTTITENMATPQYAQYALRLPSEQVNAGSYRQVIYLQGSYSAGTAQDAMGQIWFRNSNADGSNVVSIVSFENPLNETQTTTSFHAGLLPYDTWMFVTVKSDPVSKTFEVWLNDYKLQNPATGTDKFTVRRQSNFLQLNFLQIYSKNFGTAPVYIDDLTYYQDAPPAHVNDWQIY